MGQTQDAFVPFSYSPANFPITYIRDNPCLVGGLYAYVYKYMHFVHVPYTGARTRWYGVLRG